MSRLDSAIRRLQAQRSCLDDAARRIADQAGVVFELGLGNGRTYDHLRERLPDREIYVFERQVAAHPDCIPPDNRLFLGNVEETLPGVLARFRGRVALVHSDVGTGDAATNKILAAAISSVIGDFLVPGGYLVCDQQISFPGAEPVALPSDVAEGRYIYLRKPASAAAA